MTWDKALERAIHIGAVTRSEEGDKELRVSAIQLNVNTQIVNFINDLVRTPQTNQSNMQDNQKFSSQGARPKNFERNQRNRNIFVDLINLPGDSNDIGYRLKRELNSLDEHQTYHQI